MPPWRIVSAWRSSVARLRGIVEKSFVADIAHLVWEKRRLLRSKTAILDITSKDAVRRILCSFTDVDRDWAEAASAVWLTHAGFREDIIEKLEASGLDESAIEAEAMRWVPSDLEMLDRKIASLEMRIRNVLRAIADYRETFPKSGADGFRPPHRGYACDSSSTVRTLK
jgi:hypothetical protein